MEEQKSIVTVKSTSIRYGLIFGVIMILYGTIVNTMLDPTNKLFQWIPTLLFILVLVLALKYFKDNGDGYLNFGQGMGISILTTLIGGFLSSIFSYVYMAIIDPGIIDLFRDAQIAEMEENGMSQEQIDQALEMMSFMMKPGILVVIGFISMIILYTIVGLIVTAIMQKKRPVSF